VEPAGSLKKRLSPDRDRPRILLADDHSAVLERAQSLLKPLFEVVGTVNNGGDLVTEAQHLQPDIIVLDIMMPVLTGIEAAHQLREIGISAKLVFLTVHEEPAFVHACFAEGGLGFVKKSCMGTDLIPAINEALSGRHFVSPSAR
jgi:DNA-binding NarL/FixJ family response regulator